MAELDDYHYLKLNDEIVADPYPFFRRLRQAPTLYRDPDYGVVVISRYDDVQEVLRQPEVFSSIAAGWGPFRPLPPLDDLPAWRDAHPLLDKLATNDPPDHTRHRRILNRLFTPRSVTRLEPRIRELANELIDEFVGDGVVELQSRFANLLPSLVISELLGVPDTDIALLRERMFRNRAAALTSSGDPMEDARRAQERINGVWNDLTSYFTEAITARRRDGRTDDVLGELADAHFADGAEVPITTLVGLIVTLYLAGGEANTNELLVNIAMMLARRPDLQGALRADPDAIEPFVEEVLRYETPLLGLYRAALEDADVGGEPVSKGEILLVLFASANHDEVRFESAEEFRPGCPREQATMSFGHGAHFCPGAPLARLEGRVVTAVLVDRLRNLRLAPDAPTRPDYLPSLQSRVPLGLHVAFDPAP